MKEYEEKLMAIMKNDTLAVFSDCITMMGQNGEIFCVPNVNGYDPDNGKMLSNEDRVLFYNKYANEIDEKFGELTTDYVSKRAI